MFLTNDVNRLSRDRLLTLDLPEETVAAILERRDERPFASLDELAELPGVTPELVEALLERGVTAGTYVDPDAPRPRRTRVWPAEGPALTGLATLPAAGALADVFTGFGQVMNGIGRLFQQQGGDGPPPRPRRPRPPEDRAPRIPDTSVYRERELELPGGDRVYALEVLPCYCVKVWILLGGAGGGDGNGAHAHGAGAAGAGALRTPTQSAVDEIATDIRIANSILEQCGVSLCLCAVHVLDTRQVRTPDGQRSLSDALFTAQGVIFGEGRGSDPLEVLFQTLWNRFPTEFDFRCVHLFYARDVQESPTEADSERRKVRGFGGYQHPGGRVRRPQYTPMGVVEGGSGSTVAHEVVHGLGLDHAEKSKDPAVRGDADNLMREVPTGTKLRASQCTAINAFVATHLREGCP